MKILVINGPNINMLGIREPKLYGTATYRDLIDFVKAAASRMGVEAAFFQSNHEGAIQEAYGKFDGIVINPAAYTHTSVAILDALKAVGIPAVEVHISDVSQREDFRQISYVRQAAVTTIMGKGFAGYAEAMEVLCGRKE